MARAGGSGWKRTFNGMMLGHQHGFVTRRSTFGISHLVTFCKSCYTGSMSSLNALACTCKFLATGPWSSFEEACTTIALGASALCAMATGRGPSITSLLAHKGKSML